MTLRAPSPPSGLREHSAPNLRAGFGPLISNAPHQMDNLCALLETVESRVIVGKVDHELMELLRGILYYLKTSVQNR